MRTRIALVCTVWGIEFTDFFCEYCLASLLGPESLPRATQRNDFTLLLYTLEEDLLRMRAHRNFQKLATLLDIEPVPLERLPAAARRGHWVQWHHALLRANEFSAYILLIPDCLYANDAIERIADALQNSEIVYYCIPQVALEPLLSSLAQTAKLMNEKVPYTYLSFSKIDISTLFVKFINPRYAVALHKPQYFVTHPEFSLRATPGRIELHELTCHALAISSRATSVAYTLNSPSATARTAFLELLAVGVEYTFKYFEQYFRWPSFRMQLSRLSTLASWSHNYFEPGAIEYTKTQTDIALSGTEAVTLRRTPLNNSRFRYARAALEYNAAMHAIYDGPARGCHREVRRAIALAMSLPGFRKALTSNHSSITIFLPTSKAAAEILRRLYSTGDASYVARFMLMHIVPGLLSLKTEQWFVFEPVANRPLYRPKIRVIDPSLARTLPSAIIGRVASLATRLSDDVISYVGPIRYGSAEELLRKLAKDQR
jgi:hypothetical protein